MWERVKYWSSCGSLPRSRRREEETMPDNSYKLLITLWVSLYYTAVIVLYIVHKRDSHSGGSDISLCDFFTMPLFLVVQLFLTVWLFHFSTCHFSLFQISFTISLFHFSLLSQISFMHHLSLFHISLCHFPSNFFSLQSQISSLSHISCYLMHHFFLVPHFTLPLSPTFTFIVVLLFLWLTFLCYKSNFILV